MQAQKRCAVDSPILKELEAIIPGKKCLSLPLPQLVVDTIGTFLDDPVTAWTIRCHKRVVVNAACRHNYEQLLSRLLGSLESLQLTSTTLFEFVDAFSSTPISTMTTLSTFLLVHIAAFVEVDSIASYLDRPTGGISVQVLSGVHPLLERERNLLPFSSDDELIQKIWQRKELPHPCYGPGDEADNPEECYDVELKPDLKSARVVAQALTLCGYHCAAFPNEVRVYAGSLVCKPM
ncbi:hypothetical protein DFS34DRAFT_640291 [Phlyctochytrium arcticum]|nr:hypothetical protein DFS34DRAFT_640291 [Phlyctochytrium arcticum]